MNTALPVRRVPLADLRPAPYNPRVALRPGDPGWEKLARSVAGFGLVQPLVYNARAGRVVGGHQRLAVLRHHLAAEQGCDPADVRGDVPCVVVDLPEPEEKALCVALNNAEVGGAWDGGKLVDLLADLRTEALLPDADCDPTLTGFDERAIDALLMTPATLPDAPAAGGDSYLSPGGLPGDADVSGPVRVTLTVPPGDWPAVRPAVDALLAAHPVGVRVEGEPDA